ncbi:CDP-diacylglycerol---serine O-phosphatidyltransferase [termite gut metagenome]|uniref:CDP-diacylglycerol--serine O-phosphatidyltransferase n=1 Tax=termite gut metagenome TaxID=433724 RepID=A0A5J4SKN9_9ZZZZ
MPNVITRGIPNTVTCLNLFSGCMACVEASEAKYEWAAVFIILSAIFDFFDGLLARLFKVYSPNGKELDSLADDISFGLAPALILFSLFKEVSYPSFLLGLKGYIPYLAFLIAVFSALRLAKFNIDTRQSRSFIGLPTPANALFWASIAMSIHHHSASSTSHILYLLVALTFLFSWLLVAEIPMFSLKFENLSWKDNKISFIFLTGCLPLFVILKTGGFAAIIGWYILLSLLAKKKMKQFLRDNCLISL